MKQKLLLSLILLLTSIYSFSQELIKNGAALEAKTPLNETALFLAKSRKNEKVAAILESKGAILADTIHTKLSGKYFGQKSPGMIAQIFAPGIVSRCSLDGQYLFFVSNFGYIKWINAGVIEGVRP